MGLLSYWTSGTGVITVALIAASILALRPHIELDWDRVVVPLAQKYSGGNASTSSLQPPLEGTTIVITGATNGIGLALTRTLSKLGGSVIAVGRSQTKLEQLRQEMPSVHTFQMDLSDLSAVSRAADEMVSSLAHIDILINNAGMHAGFDFLGKDTGVGDNPPYDRVFVVNFLSHVLLTEKLMPLLAKSHKPVIAQMSSSFHWASDGSDLVSETSSAMPIAARPGGSTGFFLFRAQRSYANSKLANIYHARMLQKDATRWFGENNNFRAVSICPSWVATGIVRESSLFSYILETFAFPMEGWGVASTLHALFSDDDQSEHDWYTNSDIFRLTEFLITSETPSWMYSTLPVRDALVGALAPLALFLQAFTAHAGPNKSSPESYNETKAKELYAWSKNAVAPYF